MLTREQILEADDIKREEIDVPEWGGKILVQTMNSKDRDRWEEKQVNDPYNNIRASLIAKMVVDEAGERVFTNKDIEALGAKSSGPMAKIFKICQDMNGLTKEDIDKLEKNSESDQNESSGTN